MTTNFQPETDKKGTLNSKYEKENPSYQSRNQGDRKLGDKHLGKLIKGKASSLRSDKPLKPHRSMFHFEK